MSSAWEKIALRKLSLGLMALLIAACYFVPYGLLGDVESWRGAFLFWTVAGLLVIDVNAMATASFGNDEE